MESHLIEYYGKFQPMSIWLESKAIISKADKNNYFWYGIPKKTRKLILSQLIMLEPDRDNKKAPEMEEVLKAERYILSEEAFDVADDNPIANWIHSVSLKEKKRQRMKAAIDEHFQGLLLQQTPSAASMPTATTFRSSNLFQRPSVNLNASSFTNISTAETKEDKEETMRRQEEEVKAFQEQYKLAPWVDEQGKEAEDEGMVWSAFPELERFNEEEEVDVFTATRSKGKEHQQLIAAKSGEKMTEKAK
ncbi:hypothetical protein M413DRAFT_23585 [Hebeloma cylindrosporum]|uniref:Uncharacterized protein n=1 Tax=Hebeloma cylindrosporum TaxID=76867 RepID=A0A0C2YXS5_HEBCY|nr:hypothetical protein M413DRAFT_23585 [Hebeloma cylindrosporum h7]